MADPFTPSYIEEPNNIMISSDPSSNSEDANLTCSCNINECHCKEQHQHQQKKNKKRRKKISHIIKSVVGFSFVKKKLKTTKKSHKKRRDDNDDKINPTPTTTTIHECRPPQFSPENDYSASPSPFPGFEDVNEPTEEESAAAAATMSPTRRIFGMHHVMLMISLAALVLSGKACAIFATIVWLILLPLTSRFGNGRRPRWGLQLGRKCDDRDLVVRKFMARF